MAQSVRQCYCSVPGCSNNKQSHPYMSYHDFPKDASRRALWIRAIGRDEGPTFTVQCGSTYVCSFHFRPEELYETQSGLTALKNQVVPSRFHWNGWGNVYERPTKRLCCEVPNECVEAVGTEDIAQGLAAKATWDHDYAACPCKLDGAARKTKDLELQLMKEMMTQQSQEAKQTDREPEEKLEIKALFQNKRIPANVLCGESSDGLQLQDHLHIKKEEEELWESLEVKQETDITAVTVKSEDEEEEAQCSLLHWRQSEENIKGEPATCSSAKVMKVEPHGDISEGPEAANTCRQPDTDGEETDCSDTEDSEDWREPLSQSEAQSEHMDMSCDRFHTSENNTKGTSHNTQKPHGCDVCGKRFGHRALLKIHTRIHTGLKPFGCDVCEKRFRTISDLKRHKIIHTGWKSSVCGKRSDRSTLKTHTRIHTRQKLCLSQKIFIQKGDLNQQMEILTRAGITKRRTLVRVRTHRGRHVGLDPQTNQEELWEIIEEKRERNITSVTVNSEDEEEEAQCSLLHWRQSEENIKGEPATCSSAKVMKVEPNGDISEGPEAANTCRQPDTDGEETDCSDTEDSEDWREPLSQSEAQSEHMDMSCDRFHTSENNTKGTSQKPFGCDVCGKQFSRKANMERHKRIHTGEKPFACDVCPKTYATKFALSNHKTFHMGEKPYGCDVCGKRFICQPTLKRHMRVHIEEKPYGCDVCGKQFSGHFCLKRHMKVHMEKNPYGCDVCGQ